MNVKELDDWLEKLYVTLERKGVHDVIGNIDDLLCEGRFEEVDYILEKVDKNRLKPVVLMTFSSITRAADRHLKNRGIAWNKAFEAFEAERGTEGAHQLMDKYR